MVLATGVLMAKAQKKELRDAQFFKSDFTGIIQPIPVVNRWIDDSHVLLMKGEKLSFLDCKTGVERDATAADTKTTDPPKSAAFNKGGDIYVTINGEETQLTTDKEKKINPTISPDNNYVAFTKKNDLYTINISSRSATAPDH